MRGGFTAIDPRLCAREPLACRAVQRVLEREPTLVWGRTLAQRAYGPRPAPAPPPSLFGSTYASADGSADRSADDAAGLAEGAASVPPIRAVSARHHGAGRAREADPV